MAVQIYSACRGWYWALWHLRGRLRGVPQDRPCQYGRSSPGTCSGDFHSPDLSHSVHPSQPPAFSSGIITEESSLAAMEDTQVLPLIIWYIWSMHETRQCTSTHIQKLVNTVGMYKRLASAKRCWDTHATSKLSAISLNSVIPSLPFLCISFSARDVLNFDLERQLPLAANLEKTHNPPTCHLWASRALWNHLGFFYIKTKDGKVKPSKEKQLLRKSIQILDFTLVFSSVKSKSLPEVYTFMALMHKWCCQKKQRLNTKNVSITVKYKTDASKTTTKSRRRKHCHDISKLSSWFHKLWQCTHN